MDDGDGSDDGCHVRGLRYTELLAAALTYGHTFGSVVLIKYRTYQLCYLAMYREARPYYLLRHYDL